MDDLCIAVVIPCYRVARQIEAVVSAVPARVKHIVVVDDACPEGSGRIAAEVRRAGVHVLYHRDNQGVGGAVMTGYRAALDLGADIVVKMDGDGQMDPALLDAFVSPLGADEADYAKGNRFHDFSALKNMPQIRLFGNSVLSFLVKFSSGYWNIMDPTNGYTAIHRRVLEKLNFDSLSRRYFFETDMLINLNIVNAVVRDIPLPARYGGEVSSLSAGKALFQFPPRLLSGAFKRLFLKYFIHDFNMASVYVALGLPLFAGSVLYGIVEWVDSVVSGSPKSAGTIMLVALPIIVSFQMLLQAVSIDIASIPRKDR